MHMNSAKISMFSGWRLPPVLWAGVGLLLAMNILAAAAEDKENKIVRPQVLADFEDQQAVKLRADECEATRRAFRRRACPGDRYPGRGVMARGAHRAQPGKMGLKPLRRRGNGRQQSAGRGRPSAFKRQQSRRGWPEKQQHRIRHRPAPKQGRLDRPLRHVARKLRPSVRPQKHRLGQSIAR